MAIEDIIGAKSKIRIIEAMAGKDAGLSIKAIADEADVVYSVAHRDIGMLLSEGFLSETDGKFTLNREHALYRKVMGLFSDDSGRMPLISNRQKKDIEKLLSEVKKHKLANVVVHHNADPDAIGSACAIAIMLKHFGVKVVVSAPLGVSLQGRALIEKYPFDVSPGLEKDATIVIIVDSSSFEQVGELAYNKKPMVALVDHHLRGGIAKAADVSYVDTEAKSSAILVYRMIKMSRADVWKAVAPYILAGIVADTAFFRIAGRDDIACTDELLGFVGLDEIFEAITVKEDISERIAKLKVLKRAQLYRVRDMIIAFSQTGSFESRGANHLVKTGADVAFVFNTDNKELRISGRMRKFLSGDIDLVQVLRKAESMIGGSVGGHAEAASANGTKADNVNAIRNRIVKEFEERANSRAKIIN